MPHMDSVGSTPEDDGVAADTAGPRPKPGAESGAAEALAFPVREYIGAMCIEMARMARWDGDESLALLLNIAARLAEAAPADPVHSPQA